MSYNYAFNALKGTASPLGALFVLIDEGFIREDAEMEDSDIDDALDADAEVGGHAMYGDADSKLGTWEELEEWAEGVEAELDDLDEWADAATADIDDLHRRLTALECRLGMPNSILDSIFAARKVV